MGLRTWKGAEPLQNDALIAKNYLAGGELRELNRLTTILLDIFEDQLDLGHLTLMVEAKRLLDKQLVSLNRSLLTHGGNVRHDTAEAHAKAEYKKFDEARRIDRAERAQRELAELKATGKKLPKTVGGGAKKVTPPANKI